MKDNYVVYKGVRMTEQEAEERINEAYCNAADKARARTEGRSIGGTSAKTKAATKNRKS